MRKSRLIAALLALAMCASLITVAVAVPTDVVDAKDDLAVVDITQVYNTVETDSAVHNYDANGNEVNITYSASLCMTEEMAIYLNARQTQLVNAKFNVHVMMDMDVLEFTGTGDTLTVTFSSSFLKPWDVDDNDIRTYPAAFSDYKAGVYSYTLTGCTNGVFTYQISVDKAWAQNYAETKGYIDVPMELVVYYDGTSVYGFEDLPGSANSAVAHFANFAVEDWLKEINISTADVRVKDSIPATITSDPATWRYVYASGTVDGEFTYEKAHKIDTINDYKYAFNTTTLEFGNGFVTDGEDVIEEWTSNRVQVLLARYDRYDPPVDPNSPYLNLQDHFAYIIGYPDGNVYPEGTITRAEVATIFFRMLTDEVRSKYWSKTNPYSDVDSGDWYNNAISTLTAMGVVEGYEGGIFNPTGNITRAEFATMAVRFFQHTEVLTYDEDAFNDINGHWANRYINLAYLLEIVNGYPDGSFRPQQAITRAEAMTMVNNTLRRTPCTEGVTAVEEHEDFITWSDNMDKTMWYYAEVQEATNSHDCTYYTGDLAGSELWVDILPVRDWAAFEKAWSDANSAANPGDVVG